MNFYYQSRSTQEAMDIANNVQYFCIRMVTGRVTSLFLQVVVTLDLLFKLLTFDNYFHEPNVKQIFKLFYLH